MRLWACRLYLELHCKILLPKISAPMSLQRWMLQPSQARPTMLTMTLPAAMLTWLQAMLLLAPLLLSKAVVVMLRLPREKVAMLGRHTTDLPLQRWIRLCPCRVYLPPISMRHLSPCPCRCPCLCLCRLCHAYLHP